MRCSSFWWLLSAIAVRRTTGSPDERERRISIASGDQERQTEPALSFAVDMRMAGCVLGALGAQVTQVRQYHGASGVPMVMPTRPVDVIESWRSQRMRLRHWFSEPSAERWSDPTRCSDWSVRDIAQHLIWVRLPWRDVRPPTG
jgi:hypothetical protein